MPWRALVPVTLVVGLFYVAVVGLSIRRYGWNVSSLITVGDRAGETQPHGLGSHVVIFRRSDGYDGQTFYYVADDPFLQRRAFRDPFRYQRIGYPLLIWAISLGQRDARPIAMVAINIAAVMMIAALAALIIHRYNPDASPWWGALCAINPSLILGVQLDLAEPLAVVLALSGLLLYLRRHIVWCVVAFVAALLTREVTVLFLAPLIIAELTARRFRQALALALSAAPYLLWQAVLARVFGHAGAQDSAQANFGLPFAGVGVLLDTTRHGPVRLALIHDGPILAIVAVMIASVIIAVMRLRRRPEVIAGGVLTHGVAALFASGQIILAYASAARVFGGLYPLAIIVYAGTRSRAFGWLTAAIVALTVFTLFRAAFISPAVPYSVTP